VDVDVDVLGRVWSVMSCSCVTTECIVLASGYKKITCSVCLDLSPCLPLPLLLADMLSEYTWFVSSR
jgi:hypothetical protein